MFKLRFLATTILFALLLLLFGPLSAQTPDLSETMKVEGIRANAASLFDDIGTWIRRESTDSLEKQVPPYRSFVVQTDLDTLRRDADTIAATARFYYDFYYKTGANHPFLWARTPKRRLSPSFRGYPDLKTDQAFFLLKDSTWTSREPTVDLTEWGTTSRSGMGMSTYGYSYLELIFPDAPPAEEISYATVSYTVSGVTEFEERLITPADTGETIIIAGVVLEVSDFTPDIAVLTSSRIPDDAIITCAPLDEDGINWRLKNGYYWAKNGQVITGMGEMGAKIIETVTDYSPARKEAFIDFSMEQTLRMQERHLAGEPLTPADSPDYYLVRPRGEMRSLLIQVQRTGPLLKQTVPLDMTQPE